MPTIHLIRHGHVAPADRMQADPALDELGRAQAAALADTLAERFAQPLPILVSPLRRCRETAAPLCERWASTPIVEPRVAEIPSPSGEPTLRSAWLQRIATLFWHDLADAVDPDFAARLTAWQRGVLRAIAECKEDTLVFSHAFAIGWAHAQRSGDTRIDALQPQNASMLSIEI
jgi:broad specificity phosphatase PhoE